jgi:hypothetical protein
MKGAVVAAEGSTAELRPVRAQWLASCPGRFDPGKGIAGTRCIGNWTDLNYDVEDGEERKTLLYHREPNPFLTLTAPNLLFIN